MNPNEWPPLPGEDALLARLRTTADALRSALNAYDFIWACFPGLSEVLTDEQIASLDQTQARGIIATLKKEGLLP